ncbi:hypothetical protein NW762_007916 [Fusarium torreyae]|uniref:Nephrocystin 3-like N-terminal domain-containing protein n=1 Tax=Fusarium torreyae TaxID=1237075 RepID=A0A9W8RWN6_9HYPO|nr:hypothetical protein NW762_007916 [Fusarium torreyae]
MAEVVGLVAASGQFVEQSIKIVKLSKRIRDKFKDAPQELEGWREEIDSLQKAVHKIQTTPALQVDDIKPIINQLKDAGGELLKLLNGIGFLETESFGHKSWKVAVGLSKEEEVRDLFARLERLKSTLYIHLSIININQNQDDQANLASRMENMKLSFQSGTDEEQCLRALFVTDPLSDREGLVTTKGQRTQGTCEWIPKTQKYQDWNATRDGLLWISGPPGKGKTIMSIYLTRLLEESRPDATVIWFLCDNKTASRNSAVNVLRGLMTQLIQTHPHLISFLLSTWKLQRDGLFRPNSFETLWRILSNMLKALEDEEVCCVLDALDECDEESLSSLLSKLQTFFRPHLGSGARPALKLIITSREQPQCLPNNLSSFPRIVLDNLDHDIDLYITDRVTHLARIKGIQNTPLQRRIKEAFQDGAEGTFLWVSLVAADLEQKTLDGIENALTQLPSGLYSIYESIIGQIKSESRHTISEMLTWILFAKSPLQIAELCDAIQIRPTDTLTREEICFGYVQSCGHLLQLHVWDETRSSWGAHEPPGQVPGQEMRNGILGAHQEDIGSFRTTFVHQSVKDFLLNNTIDHSILDFTFDGKAGHATISDRLIELLSKHLNNEVLDQTDTLE